MLKLPPFCLCVILFLSGTAAANEAAVRQAMQKKYPNIPVDSVTKSPIPGLYEVYAGGEVLYADENVNYLITRGRMIDVERKTDLTAERLQTLSAVKFDQLPLDLAFRKVQGNGTRRIAYFTDPNCPYCKQIEPRLAKLENVTIYVFLYPVLGQDSYDKAKAVWCSKDRVKTYDDMMLNGRPPRNPGNCDTPIDKIIAFGRQKSINGTPTLFLADGQRISGAIPEDQLRKLVDSAR